MQTNLKKSLHVALAILGLAAIGSADASEQDQINELLGQAEAPSGVVFEVGTDDEDALETLLPKIKGYAKRLRARFPDLEISVVSHGVEMFSLSEKERETYPNLHQAVKSLTKEEDIPVHVCGTHASWRDKSPEDFPEYVDVPDSGPAQVNDYASLGFVVVRLF